MEKVRHRMVKKYANITYLEQIWAVPRAYDFKLCYVVYKAWFLKILTMAIPRRESGDDILEITLNLEWFAMVCKDISPGIY